jgi:hypothetical protein
VAAAPDDTAMQVLKTDVVIVGATVVKLASDH